jgi:Glycosyl hydrolases family 28
VKQMQKPKIAPIIFAGLLVILTCCADAGENHNSQKAIFNRNSLNNSADVGTAGIFNIKDFGAVGDGVTLSTSAIQKAIDVCHDDSGGIVLVPPGKFLTGTLELKSNVTLKVAAAGRILGSSKIEDYYQSKGVPPGNGNYALIYAANAKNITIEGNGTIDGQGASYFNGRGDGTGPGQHGANMERPHLIIFYNCQNVFVHDIFLTESAYHCMRILNCRYVKLEGIRIFNRVNKNNDGFHFGSSEYVNISDCNIKCQDDACALFGSNKFVTITNCTFSTRWSVFRFGGGEPENITISNCVIYETYGCPIKMRFGSGDKAENITFSNLIMNKVTGPISLDLGSGQHRGHEENASERPAGILKNIFFNGIYATVVDSPLQISDIPFPPSTWKGEQRQCIVLNGVGGSYLQNISFTDVHVTYEGGGTIEEAANRNVPEVAGEYFQIGTPPAYGMYARNVKGLRLENVTFNYLNRDVRPAVVFNNVSDASINNLSVEGNPDAESALRFINSKKILLSNSRLLTPAKVFLQVEGEDNKDIKIDGGDFTGAEKLINYTRGGAAGVVKVHE